MFHSLLRRVTISTTTRVPRPTRPTLISTTTGSQALHTSRSFSSHLTPTRQSHPRSRSFSHSSASTRVSIHSPSSTCPTTLAQLRELGPERYGPSTVLLAIGMRPGVWSVSPRTVEEKHSKHHWEESHEGRVEQQRQHIDAQREHFDQWIASVLRQRGLAGDPSTFTDDQFNLDDQLKKRMDDVLDRIERYQARPELYVWCRLYLKDIFRFSNEEGMGKPFTVTLGGDDMKNMIRYKTFIEKERYKMMRDRECITEIQLQFSHNLDSLQEYFKTINPRVSPASKFVHPKLKPIYDSMSLSLASILEVSDMLAVLHPFFVNYDKNVATAMQEDRMKDALKLIQQQAAFARGAAKISRGLLEYVDTTLYEFEDYYNPARVRNLIEYARLEMDPKRRFKLDQLTLPTPPMVEIDSDALYRAIGDATEGVVGHYEPESPAYFPIDHVPLSEKLLQTNQKPKILTPIERNARFKMALEELGGVKQRRSTDIARLHQKNLNKVMAGYTTEELDTKGAKFHLSKS